MAPEATLPRSDVNVPGDYFSLAGFEVIMHGRFWVLTEAIVPLLHELMVGCGISYNHDAKKYHILRCFTFGEISAKNR
jgi:hypothetical protein